MNQHKNRSLARVRAFRASGQLFSFANIAAAAAFALIAIAATGPAARAQSVTATASAPQQQPGTVELEAYVVSASRTAQNVKLTPSSVTSISLSHMENLQIPDLRTALQTIPGVNVSETGGAAGSQSAIYIRGANRNQTLFLIDGIRMNAEDWTGNYANYLGAADLAGFDRVEVLRGPQSTLYGSAAMGGVVSLETARGRGSAHGSVSIEGGSFNSIGGTAAIAGRKPLMSGLSASPQSLSYSASLSASYTENDRDYNIFRQASGSTRIEYQLADSFTAGFTYRGLRSHYEEPGPVGDPTQAGDLNLNLDIATVYVDWSPIAAFDTRLTYGWVQNIYDWVNRDGSWPSNAHSTRNVIDWQNTWRAIEQIQVVAGVNAEWSHYDSGDAPASERLASAYINVVANPVKNLELTAGVRGDDYSTLDSHATWRAGAAYRIEQSKTTFRATYGTGFNAPAPQYAQGGGHYAPSPDLKPEKSKGWDIGVEQDLWNDRITLGATYFRNDFDNKFAWDYGSYPYPTYNIPDATTKGVETYIYARPVDNMGVQIAYTYLDTRDNNGACLPRMPRHVLAADVNYQFTKRLFAGVGFNWVGGRPVDSSWATSEMPSYSTVRLYGGYEVCSGLKLKLRLENLFNKKYDTVAGYPALPFGVFGGIEWKF
ncbi:TonB-dependent receptor plug domain-containing protein [Ereboglobus luteus]|uniref:TonB-dependent receptor plug domain-containing protein n=1 Tax=Ereboglobus luteus TaxID=1796921 RepID=UPI001374C7DE|nr:TonB-dependent receptor [Ereboglobus luteus]